MGKAALFFDLIDKPVSLETIVRVFQEIDPSFHLEIPEGIAPSEAVLFHGKKRFAHIEFHKAGDPEFERERQIALALLARAREEVPGPVQAMIRDARRILSIDPLASEASEEDQPRSSLQAFQDWWFAHRVGLLRIEQVGFFQDGKQFLAETRQEDSGPLEGPFGSHAIPEGRERAPGWILAIVGVIFLVGGVVSAFFAVDVEDYLVMIVIFLAGFSYLGFGISLLWKN